MTTLIQFLPLLFLATLGAAGALLRPARRGAWTWIVLPALGLGLLDLAMLELLPVLGLSFGPVGVPLFAFSLARLGLALPALAVILPGGKGKRPGRAVVALSGGIQAALTLLAFYGLYIEPFHLTETTLRREGPSLLMDRSLRIVQVADLHMEHPTKREAEILERIESLQPDLIVLTGDYLNPTYLDDPLSIAETRQFLAQLHAPYGVYAVNGTVDDFRLMSSLFDGLEGIRVLDDAVELLQFPGGTLALLGVKNTFEPGADRQALLLMAEQVPVEAYTLLLYHTPDLVETASRAGIDLYLAGHTHGGQIRLPFYGALVTFSAFGKQYEMGEYRVGGTTLYVSRGLGMEGWDAPRMRFLCPPELVVVELGE